MLTRTFYSYSYLLEESELGHILAPYHTGLHREPITLMGEDAEGCDKAHQGNMLMDSGSKLTLELTSMLYFHAPGAVQGSEKCLYLLRVK